MRLGGPQSRSGRRSEERNSQPLPELEPPNHPALSPALYRWDVVAPNVWEGARICNVQYYATDSDEIDIKCC